MFGYQECARELFMLLDDDGNGFVEYAEVSGDHEPRRGCSLARPPPRRRSLLPRLPASSCPSSKPPLLAASPSHSRPLAAPALIAQVIRTLRAQWKRAEQAASIHELLTLFAVGSNTRDSIEEHERVTARLAQIYQQRTAKARATKAAARGAGGTGSALQEGAPSDRMTMRRGGVSRERCEGADLPPAAAAYTGGQAASEAAEAARAFDAAVGGGAEEEESGARARRRRKQRGSHDSNDDEWHLSPHDAASLQSTSSLVRSEIGKFLAEADVTLLDLFRDVLSHTQCTDPSAFSGQSTAQVAALRVVQATWTTRATARCACARSAPASSASG